MEVTEGELGRIRAEAERRTNTPLTAKEIALKVGRKINKWKMAKHFRLTIEDSKLEWSRKVEAIGREEELDGIYIIRTSESDKRLSAPEAVRQYKNLSQVERIFRTCKGVDILIRPIRHRLTGRVRAHIFLCMLTYYVQYYIKEALRPMLFADDDLEYKAIRDPVAPAKRSRSALKKVSAKKLEDGTPAESLRTLLHHMSTLTRDTFVQKLPSGQSHTFDLDTRPDPNHQKVYARIADISL